MTGKPPFINTGIAILLIGTLGTRPIRTLKAASTVEGSISGWRPRRVLLGCVTGDSRCQDQSDQTTKSYDTVDDRREDRLEDQPRAPDAASRTKFTVARFGAHIDSPHNGPHCNLS